jgi:hypothetical protein
LGIEKGRPEDFRTPGGGAEWHFDMLICPLETGALQNVAK